jgi:hypothetical protein
MVPSPDSAENDPSEEKPSTSMSDGGSAAPTIDEGVLYGVIRKAVKDALLDVIGTLLLVGLAVVLIWIGGASLLSSVSLLGGAFGAIIAIVGLYIAAATLEIIPPIRDWI